MIRDLPRVISWLPTGKPEGPAIGDPERIAWRNVAQVLSLWRREGEKDGPGFVPARFKSEPDGKDVRRLETNLIARTAVAMDCKTNKESGEVPPSDDDAAAGGEPPATAGLLDLDFATGIPWSDETINPAYPQTRQAQLRLVPLHNIGGQRTLFAEIPEVHCSPGLKAHLQAPRSAGCALVRPTPHTLRRPDQ